MPATTAMLKDFHKGHDGWYRFDFTAEGEDFYKTLALLKTLRLEDRMYNHVTRTWALRVGPGSEALLAEAFANGASCVATVNAQLRLL